MPLLNFQQQFADKVEKKIKRQTIRAWRKYPIRTGQILYLYTRLRTKLARRIGMYVCFSAQSIVINEDSFTIDGLLITNKKRLNLFAVKDGFESWNDMISWFKKTHGLPFRGQLIKW